MVSVKFMKFDVMVCIDIDNDKMLLVKVCYEGFGGYLIGM